MRILLINPSLINENIGHYSKRLEKLRGVYPSLGLSYVASALLKAGHKVKIIDLDAEFADLSDINRNIEEFKPKVVGIHTMTWTFRQAREIAGAIKKCDPEIITLAGGPNVTSFPELTLKTADFDFAILGEGEISAVEFMKTLENGSNFKDVKGLIFREGERINRNEPREFINNLDELSFPARHLLKINNYKDVFTRNKKFATMITSRGCPFNCTFCDRENRMGKRWRMRSADNVVEEIGKINSDYGIKEIMFWDDEFVIKKNRVYELCEKIRKYNLKVLWECRARVDMVDKPLLKAMKEAGCYRIRFGFESGDNKILENLKKDITVEQSLECAKTAKEVGIEVFGYFMMGSPGETLETLGKTLNLALKVDPDFAIFSKTVLIAGSELFEWGVVNGQISEDHWEKFLNGEPISSAPTISTKILPSKMVDNYISYSNRKFYLRPSYIMKRLKQISGLKQLYYQAQMARGVLVK